MSAVENNVTQSGQPSLSKQDLSTLDVTKLTALSPEVISRQATINIGTIGHVAHGKSTVVKAVSGVQTVRFKNELERNITIKLEETAAQPKEDSEQTPIESSRTCESFYLCDSQNPDPGSDENSQNHIELQPSNTSQPPQYTTILNHCKPCSVVLTKDDALIEKYIAEFSKKSYTKRAYTKRAYTKRSYTKRNTGDERKKRGLEDSSQQIKKKSKTSTEIDEIKRKSKTSTEIEIKRKSKTSTEIEEIKRKSKTSTDVDDEYTVESILNYVQTENGDLFLVKWRGWTHEYDTWEPYKHLTNCHKALCKFFDSQVYSEESSKGVEELREKLGKIDDLTLFLKEFRDFWGFFKLPEVNRAETESLLRGIANYSISDPLLIKEVERQVKLCTVWELRNKQLEKLKAWENELNESSTNKGLITVENNFDLDGPPEGFRYINDCVAGENVVIPDEPPIGCNCEPDCNKNSQSCCGTIWNNWFPYGAFSKLRVGPGMPIYECNKRCGCGPDCRNRVVQKGQVFKLCIFKTTNNCGWGLKTLETIKQGRFIATYVGEMITSDEAERRGKQYDKEGCTYLFDLDFNDVNNSLYTVDAAHMGNVTHFINHSCDPNLQVHAVFINCLDLNIPQLALFACRDIVAGEQLSFDYLCKNDSSTIDPVELKQSTQCQCDSSNCRKYLF